MIRTTAIAPAANGPSANDTADARDGAARRRAILDAATRLFLNEGYGAATTNALVARTGGSKSTIYSYFESKEKLFAAVVDHVLARLATATEDIEHQATPLREGLYALGVRLLAIVLSDDHIALARVVIGEARRFPEIGAIYYDQGPALAQRGVVAYLAAHRALPGAGIDGLRDAAEWFTGRLIHRAFVQALCGSGRAATPGEIADIVRGTVAGFMAHFVGADRCEPA